MNETYSGRVNVKESESTEIGLVKNDNNIISETSSMNDFLSIKGNNQTWASTDSVISIDEEKTINYSKPWRKIIKRRVVDGGNYNEG